MGLQDDAHRRLGQFSKGMQMRLTFARALLNRPAILFLDEPTAGLDPGNADNIKRIIRDLQVQGRTIFLTTHDMHAADELCDRVAFIVDGRIALIDSPRALKLRYGARRVRVDFRADGRLETVDFPLEGLADNAAFLGLLRQHPVETLHSQEASLAEVFIRVTGRALS